MDGDPIRTFALNAGYLVVSDFNNDGRHDVFTAGGNLGSDLGAFGDVLLGRGDGTFYGLESFPLGMEMPTQIGVGDHWYSPGFMDVGIGGYDQNFEYVVVTLINDGNWPSLPQTLRIGDVTVAEGNAGTVAATFTVTQPSGSTEVVTVAYSTGNGTATAGGDYQTASGTLTFAVGETEKTITVQVNGDRLAEPDETFVVNLSNPTNATISNGQATGTILDDEPRISITDVAKSEGRKGQTTLFTFMVMLTIPGSSLGYDQPVTVSFQTVNGTAKTSDKDYIARTGTLTFAPGETTKTITVQVNGDSKRESNEYFYLDLFGNSSNSWFTKRRGLGTIVNDD
jgi:hypothetical protein